MKALILLIALIVLAGCGHTHPVAEHEHPHEHNHHHSHLHDHTHESEAVALHKELVGKYRLEEYNDGKDYTDDNQIRGVLTIGLDYKFVIVVQQFLDFDDARYYSILPDRPLFVLYDSRKEWLLNHNALSNTGYWLVGSEVVGTWQDDSYWLEFKWDDPILTLISYSSYDPTTMKWRKLGVRGR